MRYQARSKQESQYKVSYQASSPGTIRRKNKTVSATIRRKIKLFQEVPEIPTSRDTKQRCKQEKSAGDGVVSYEEVSRRRTHCRSLLAHCRSLLGSVI